MPEQLVESRDRVSKAGSGAGPMAAPPPRRVQWKAHREQRGERGKRESARRTCVGEQILGADVEVQVLDAKLAVIEVELLMTTVAGILKRPFPLLRGRLVRHEGVGEGDGAAVDAMSGRREGGGRGGQGAGEGKIADLIRRGSGRESAGALWRLRMERHGGVEDKERRQGRRRRVGALGARPPGRGSSLEAEAPQCPGGPRAEAPSSAGRRQAESRSEGAQSKALARRREEAAEGKDEGKDWRPRKKRRKRMALKRSEKSRRRVGRNAEATRKKKRRATREREGGRERRNRRRAGDGEREYGGWARARARA